LRRFSREAKAQELRVSDAMKFTAPPPSFSARKGDQADVCPAPITAKATARHAAAMREAKEVLAVLPGPGETLHAIMTGRYDAMHIVAALIGQLGRCETARYTTLSYSRKNLGEMLRLFDSGAVGKMTLLCSAFFRDHNKELWEETLAEFRDRGQRAAAARSHCKVVALACADGRKLVMEGSANLRTNSNLEQFTLTHDARVHDWHARWIDAKVSKHEGDDDA
jgi:hypothetical protein